MTKQYDHLIKLILVGDSGVGKSSLLAQYTQNKFSNVCRATLGDTMYKTVQRDGKRIKFQIWDTAGQQRFKTISSAYYKHADGIIMVYDLSDLASVDDLESRWIAEAEKYCDASVRVLLLGNKCDAEKRVSPQRIKQIVEKHRYTAAEVSAKTGERVYESITDLGIKIAKAKLAKMGGILSSASIETNRYTQTQIDKNISNPQKSLREVQNEQICRIYSLSEPIEILNSEGNSKKGVPNLQKKCW